MNIIPQKGRIAWQLAIATALGAYGGFPTPPEWWTNLSKNELFQFVTLWLLIYQANGDGEFKWTTLVACVVYFGMKFSQKLLSGSFSLSKSDE